MALALVNKATAASDAGATTLAATAASHTTGNLIVVGVVWSNNVTATGVPTDTAGNTYVSTGIKVNNGTTDHVEIFYAKNITGNASNIVTAHFSASASFRRIMVYQYSGADTTAPFTTGEGNTGVATGTSVTTSSWTTATANEVICAFMGSSGGLLVGSMAGGSGFTLESKELGGDSGGEDKIIAATGSQTASFSWTTSQTAWCAAASFKAAGGGSTQAIAPAAITASSSMTSTVTKLAKITGSVNATSAMVATVTKRAAITPAAVTATSVVSASIKNIDPIAPGALTATSTVTGRVVKLAAVRQATVSATSPTNATVTKPGLASIVPAAITATSVVGAGVVAAPTGSWIAPTVGTQIGKSIDRARTR